MKNKKSQITLLILIEIEGLGIKRYDNFYFSKVPSNKIIFAAMEKNENTAKIVAAYSKSTGINICEIASKLNRECESNTNTGNSLIVLNLPLNNEPSPENIWLDLAAKPRIPKND